MDVLGLDIGGANLKAAHTGGAAASKPFALWRSPERLADGLRELVAPMPSWQRVAVTMTGELCDCFTSKRQGVEHILDAAAEVFGAGKLDVWTNTGRFSDARTAKDCWLLTASANWLALATLAGRFAPAGRAVLLDIGTTTTDLIPLLDGRPVPQGFTDRDRLASGELIYRGWRRTPLCALYPEGAAELFATMHDVCLLTYLVAEDEADRDTADGQPATVEAAARRVARMLCADVEEFPVGAGRMFAFGILERFRRSLSEGFLRVSARSPSPIGSVILSGSGAFLAGRLDAEFSTRLSLEEHLGPGLSSASCAYAVAVLRSEAGR